MPTILSLKNPVAAPPLQVSVVKNLFSEVSGKCPWSFVVLLVSFWSKMDFCLAPGSVYHQIQVETLRNQKVAVTPAQRNGVGRRDA
ncbi:MAG: hypothetical protein LBK99_12810 [Opitutaceae bacterium]|nr:hypothetical protein [Opitutaceae bacterium]